MANYNKRSASSSWSTCPRPPVACPRSRSRSTSTPTASSTSAPRTGDGQHAVDDDHRPVLTGQDDIERMVHDAESHAERTAAAATRQRSATRPTPRLPDGEAAEGPGRQVRREREGGRDVCTRCGPRGTCGHGHRGHQDGHRELVTTSQSFSQRLYEQAAADNQATGGPQVTVPPTTVPPRRTPSRGGRRRDRRGQVSERQGRRRG